MELYLSGRRSPTACLLKMREMGALRQHDALTRSRASTALISRSIRYFDLDPLLKEKMQATVEEIRSGAFAKEWSATARAKLEIIRMARELTKALPMTEWEWGARAGFSASATQLKRE